MKDAVLKPPKEIIDRDLTHIAKGLHSLVVDISEVHLDPDNARTHGDNNIESIKSSLIKFGWRSAIVAQRNGTIRAGNGRLIAARELIEAGDERWKMAPVLFFDEGDAEAIAYAIADNRTAELAAWDVPKLSELFVGLPTDLQEVTGFEIDSINELLSELNPSPEIVEDEAPVASDGPCVARRGDVWACGRHRVLCGDSTDSGDVGLLMNGERAGCVLTDPPYGIDQRGVPYDTPQEHAELMRGVSQALPIDNGVLVAFQSTRTFPVLLDAARVAGFSLERMLWLYKAAQCTFPWRGWLLTSESILVFSIGTPGWVEVHPYSHDCYYMSEVSAKTSGYTGEGWHGSIKPLTVVADILARICTVGGSTYDPFLGSGTTLIAAEQLGRTCYGIEIDPKYIDVIVKRWQNLTGEQATLEGDGRTFDDVGTSRPESE